MDRDIWNTVMQAVHRAARTVPYRGRKLKYPHWLIVAMYLWSVFHDRCLSWACDRSHYGALFRPRKLPSISQFTRRVNDDTFQAILQNVHQQLANVGFVSQVSYLDGKPLVVSPVSKDPDAKRGKVSGGYAKGYKLHAVVTEHRRIPVWGVEPLNVAEQSVAAELWPHVRPQVLTMADSNYDSAPLHKHMHETNGTPLLTPLKGQQRVGPDGHHPVTLRQMGPQRREAVALWEEHADLARFMLKDRNNIEGVFSVLSVALGLCRLPAFVRRLHRTRRWVGSKIILYHARLLAQEHRAATAAAGAAG
jgi:hypothetical protein